MDTVSMIVRKNGGVIHAIGPRASVLEAAQRMNKERIGSLVVLEDGRMRGIVTERDLLTRVIAVERNPATTLVGDVMTREVLTCPPETPIRKAREIMRERRIRRLPVRQDEKLLGLVSIGDLNAVESERLNELVDSLEAYIHSV